MVVCQVSEAEFQLLFDAGVLYQASESEFSLEIHEKFDGRRENDNKNKGRLVQGGAHTIVTNGVKKPF